MLFPEIDETLGSELTGVVALSQYDRAFLLSVVNVSRFWGTLTNEQQGYIEALEYRIMADDITVLLQEIRDAILAGGGAGGTEPSYAVSFNPQVTIGATPCGCPEDVGLLKPSPCVYAKGTGGKWVGNWYVLPLREEGGLSISGTLEAGDYEVRVSNLSTPEQREFDVTVSYDGGGFYVPLYFFGGYNESNPWVDTFTLASRGDIEVSVRQLAGFDVGDTLVKVSVCRRKTPKGGGHEIELDVKPRPNSSTGVKGGRPVLGAGSRYIATPKDSEFTTINSFDSGMTVYRSKMEFYFELYPDLPEIVKNTIKGLIAIAFPPLGVALLADSIEVDLFGQTLVDYGGVAKPYQDGFLITVEFDLPVDGIAALPTDPLSFVDFFSVELDIITTSENETLLELLVDYTAHMFVKWAKLAIETGIE